MTAKRIGVAIGLALVLLGAAPRATSAAQVRVDVRIDLFHDRLSPYGMWITGRYGRCWVPRGRPAGWRPYTLGYWAYSDEGWVWISDEPFGWATYHYGRWYFDPEYGWVWVPGTEWGPSWVAWRSSPDYVGWAPLPPGVAVVYGSTWDPRIDFVSFTFVRTRYLTSRDVRTYYEPVSRNQGFVRATVNTTRFEAHGSVVFARGVGVDVVEHATGRAIPRMTVQTSDQPAAARVERDRVVVYRPTGPAGGERATAASRADRGAAPAITTTDRNHAPATAAPARNRTAGTPQDSGRVTATARGKSTPQDDRRRTSGPAQDHTPPESHARSAGPTHNAPPAEGNNHGRSAGPAQGGPPPKAPADHGRVSGPAHNGPAQPEAKGKGDQPQRGKAPDDKGRGDQKKDH